MAQAGRPLQRWKATFLASSNSRDPLSHFVVVELTTIGHERPDLVANSCIHHG